MVVVVVVECLMDSWIIFMAFASPKHAQKALPPRTVDGFVASLQNSCVGR